MIEMRDGRKPVISPQLKSVSNYIDNGKVREINSPDLTTRIYQHLVLVKLGPLYYEKDNMNGLNCKPGFGITASSKSRSLIKKMKHVYYDRLDLKYCLVIDQRKCYNHSH